MAKKWSFCSPPIWDRKSCKYSTSAGNFSTENQFPTPDWGSVGPVLNYKDEVDAGVEFEKKRVVKASPNFFHIKNTSAECLISRGSPCAIPINISKTVNQSVISNYSYKSRSTADFCKKKDPLQTPQEYARNNEENSLFMTGFNGRLDALEIQGENFIVHPEWRENRQWIVVSSIKSQKSNTVKLAPEEIEENIIFNKSEDIFASDNICQINSRCVDGIGFVLLRSIKDVSLVVLNGDIENSDFESTSLKSGCLPVCSSLSSEVSGLWSVVYEDGTVEVHPAEGPQIWSTKLQADSHIGQLRWYECEFGPHPMSLLIAGRSNLFLADLRTAGSRKDNLSTAQRNILKTENMASFIDSNEQICTFKKCDKNPYVYVVLNQTVLMFDIRHCKVPCMKWQHMMSSRNPSYASTINTNGVDECLILGSKDQQSVCLMSGIWEQANNDARYCAVGMPHHVNLLRDTADLMHRRGVLFSAAADIRLRTNMIGMVPVNLTTGKEFFLITLNSPGDLISQKFTYNRKEEFREVPKSAIQAWKSWEEVLSLASSSVIPETNTDTQNEEFVSMDASSFLYGTKTLDRKGNIDHIISGLPPAVFQWNVSEKIEDAKARISKREKKGKHHGRVSNVSMNTILIKNYECESEYSRNGLEHMKKRHKSDKVDMTNIIRNLPRSSVKSLSNENHHQFKDTLSLSVLSRWNSSNSNPEDESKNEFFYGRAPFDPDKLTRLPGCLRLEETVEDKLNSTANDSLLNTDYVTSQISKTPIQKSFTPSEISSHTPSKTSSSMIKHSSKKALQKTPVRRIKRNVDGF